MMQRALRPSALVPRGFDVESAFCEGATTVITVRPTSDASLCPGCGASSRRIHSRYQRRLTDLPLAGRPVRLVTLATLIRAEITKRDRWTAERNTTGPIGLLKGETIIPKSNREPSTAEIGEQVPARPHDSGSAANETVDGLDMAVDHSLLYLTVRSNRRVRRPYRFGANQASVTALSMMCR